MPVMTGRGGTRRVARGQRDFSDGNPRNLSDIAVRDEAKEVRPDARPQARKNRRCIHWNTLRIVSAENDADGRGSFAAVERAMSDRLLGRDSTFHE
jgi:hypothetical protein